MTPGQYGHFPDSIGLFYSKPGTDFLSQHFELGLRQAADSVNPRQVLYAVTFHKAPGGGQVTIYSTPMHGTTPIAIAVNERKFSSSSILTVPGEPNSDGSSRTEHLKQSGFSPNAKYTFQFAGESFEWREDLSKKPTIRTLIRPSATSATLSTQSRETQGEASSRVPNDDQPLLKRPLNPAIVATWTEGTIPNKQGMLAALKFSDNGVAGELGDYFKLLAIISVLVACQHGSGIDGKCLPLPDEDAEFRRRAHDILRYDVMAPGKEA